MLKAIAQELVDDVRNSVTIDWAYKDSVRGKIRVMVQRILQEYDSPPDNQEQATITGIQQAEQLCGNWVEGNEGGVKLRWARILHGLPYHSVSD